MSKLSTKIEVQNFSPYTVALCGTTKHVGIKYNHTISECGFSPDRIKFWLPQYLPASVKLA